MPLKAVLLFLLQNLGHGKRCVIISFQQMLEWGNSVVPILLEEKLLVEAELATTLPCHCKEKDCVMSVIPADVSDEATHKNIDVWYFGICYKTNAVAKVEKCLLKQWQLTHHMLIDWLTNYLRLEAPKEANRAGVIQIGTATLGGESYALALGTAEELVLLVNGDAVSIAEIFHVSEGGAIEVDRALIEPHKRIVMIPSNVESTETPKKAHSAKQQVNMSETQKRQAGWQRLYREQLKKHPNKSKTWHSEQIEKKIADKGEKPVTAKHIFKYLEP